MIRIKELIQALEMTQVEFAKEFGLTKSGISEIVAGRTKSLPHSVQIRLYKEFNINPTWLLTGEGEMFLEKKEKSSPNQNVEIGDNSFGNNVQQNTGEFTMHIGKTNSDNRKKKKDDLISLEGLTAKQKDFVINLINSYKEK